MIASVDIRGATFEVEYRDHGYEPDTNGGDIEWHFIGPAPEDITPEEESSIFRQLSVRAWHDERDDRDERRGG